MVIVKTLSAQRRIIMSRRNTRLKRKRKHKMQHNDFIFSNMII